VISRKDECVMFFRKLAKDTAIYGGADLVGKSIIFVTFPIIATALSPLAFGALELIGTVTALLGMVMNCGLNNAVQRYYWDKETVNDQRPVIVTSGLVALFFFGVGTVAVSLFLLPFVLTKVHISGLPLTWIALVAALILMSLRQCHQYILDVLRLHFASHKYLFISLIGNVLSALFSVLVVVYWRWGIDGLLTVQASVALVILPLALWMIREDITLDFDSKWMLQLVHYGYPFIFAGLAYWLFGSMDRWMLAAMSSIEEVGIYSVAFRFASIVVFVSTAFGQAWSPAAIKIYSDNPSIYRNIYAYMLLLLLFFMLMVGGGIALFSGEMIGLIMSKEYLPSAVPLTILCFGIVLQSTQQVTAIGISLEKKTFIFARLTWLTALVNFVLNWILIPLFGATGAAWATTFSYLVLTGSYLYFTQRLHPLPIPWIRLSLILCLGAVLCAVALALNQSSLSWSAIGTKFLFATLLALLGGVIVPIRKLCYARKI